MEYPKSTRKKEPPPTEALLSYKRNSAYTKAYDRLDSVITKNLHSARILTRPVKYNGLWCSILVPAILFSYTCTCKVTLLYQLIAYLAVGQLCYSVMFVVFLYTSSLILRDDVDGGVAMSVCVSSILIYSNTSSSLLFTLAISTLSTCTYSSMLRKALKLCPLTFTIGEAMVVCQGLVLFICSGVLHFYCYTFQPQVLKQDDFEMSFIKIFVYTLLSSVGLIVTALYMFEEDKRNKLYTFMFIITVAALSAFLVLYWNYSMMWFPYFLKFVFYERVRIILLLSWLCLAIATVFILTVATSGECESDRRSSETFKASTVARKVFHVIASLVFLSGILYDVRFLSMAAGCAFGILVLLEAIRISKIYPLSSILQAPFDKYSDEKDCGVFAMTPIYLYMGLACPLLLVPIHKGHELELISGVLSIGVGDSAASWFGQHYGKTRWPGLNKTMEGTLCNIGAQLFFIFVLQLFGMLRAPFWLLRATIAAMISGIAEGNTVQVDNLVLPLVTLLAFQLTGFLN